MNFYPRLEMVEENPFALFDKALAAEKKANYQKAEELYLKSLEIKPDYVEALYNLGCLYFIQEKYPLCRDYLSKASALRPDFAQGFAALGHVYQKLKDQEEAIRAYQKALKLDPFNFEALLSSAELFREKGKFSIALNCLKPIEDKYPDSAQLHFQLSMNHIALGQIKEGLDSLEKAVLLEPKNPQIRNFYQSLIPD